MRPGPSQGADCLPVLLLLLRGSSQAQVCVGSVRVLSDDSNSCCALALAHAHTTHTQKHTTIHLRTRFLTSHTHTPHIPDGLCVFSAYQNDRHMIFTDAPHTHTHVYISASFFFRNCVKAYKASCCLQWSLAACQTKQGSGNRLLLDHAPLWTLDTL